LSGNNDLDKLCINTLRMLSVDMVEKARSGHPGMPMGAAPMAYALWTRLLRFNPANPRWPNRDRFVLSAGHGSALLYSLLHVAGYGMTMDDLKNFRQWGSPTPGHPEYLPDLGVECTTGPLGQGITNAVGMAIAERHLAARFNRPGYDVVGHHTYVIAGDGDLMEGVSNEAASIAGHLKLGRLICLYDDNRISLSGETALTFTEDVPGRFEALGWQSIRVEDGNDIYEITEALERARLDETRPSLIAIRTHIGFGSPKLQDNFGVHGSPLGPDETLATKRNLGWPVDETFHVPQEVRDIFMAAAKRGAALEAEWDGLVKEYATAHPDDAREFAGAIKGRLPDGWEDSIPSFPTDEKGMATRVAGGKVLNALAVKIPGITGGSADLDPSTKTALAGMGSFQAAGTGDDTVQGAAKGRWDYSGRNIAFGVREHAMGGIVNGMAYHGGLIPYGATFLIFSDYMRPSIRLAALAGLSVKYVFTHDSVALGEDGPTHQPIEQLAGLRAVPGLTVIRPCDANETAEAWRVALNTGGGPVALILSRQSLPTLDRAIYAPADGLHKGGYVIAGPKDKAADIILIATGAEVHTALGAMRILAEKGIRVSVVSMPSWELFDAQPQAYKDEVLPPEVTRRLSVEAGATMGWCRYTGAHGINIGIDRFGASAPGKVNMERFGFTAENVARRSEELLSKD
jgi:transketolase